MVIERDMAWQYCVVVNGYVDSNHSRVTPGFGTLDIAWQYCVVVNGCVDSIHSRVILRV